MRKKLCNYVIIPLFIFIAVLFSGGKSVHAASNVRINSSNFPDVNFRKRIQIYDKNHDGYLSKSEINKVKKLDLSKTLITKEQVASDIDYYCYVYDKNVEIVFADGEKIMSPFDRESSVE